MRERAANVLRIWKLATAKHLLEIKRLVLEHNKTEKQVLLREPDLMIVMTGGSMAYTRLDGVKLFERLKNRIEYATSITCTLLLRIAALPCLVCGHIAHKRQSKD